MKITADFSRITGKIKPMHAVGQPPINGRDDRMFHYLTEANIPYSRLHDTGGMGCYLYVDIPNIFRNFDADENDPASYDFAFTDVLILGLVKAGVKPFYRLGVTIENSYRIKAYNIYPPKDYKKWARICEHIIRHYNEGWANGHRLGLEYWEIWNEPEGTPDGKGDAMWQGTKQQYLELYEVASKHLKKCFGDSIRVGGPAAIGFYSCDKDPDLCGIRPEEYTEIKDWYLDYVHDFFAFVRDTKSPMDFFSWHCYSEKADEMEKHARYCRRLMAKYGFDDVPDIMNEWNPCCRIHKLDETGVPASRSLAIMLCMQKTRTSMLCFYDAKFGVGSFGSLFNPYNALPFKCYYAFRTFGNMYALENEIETSCDRGDIYVGGAVKGRKAILAVANPTDEYVECELDISGFHADDADIFVTDDDHTYIDTGRRIKDGKIRLSPRSCTEIRMYSLS